MRFDAHWLAARGADRPLHGSGGPLGGPRRTRPRQTRGNRRAGRGGGTGSVLCTGCCGGWIRRRCCRRIRHRVRRPN
eukprot:3341790-Prymnesium_polylepis.1